MCSCALSQKHTTAGLEKNNTTSILDERKTEKTVYSRYGNKILTIEKYYYKGKLDGPTKQIITFDNKILLELLIYKEDYTYHIHPANDYDVNINCDKGKLLSVCIMKGLEYIEMFKMEKNLLVPVSDNDLKKAQGTTKTIGNAFKELEFHR
jgi:hypothetical protein